MDISDRRSRSKRLLPDKVRSVRVTASSLTWENKKRSKGGQSKEFKVAMSEDESSGKLEWYC